MSFSRGRFCVGVIVVPCTFSLHYNNNNNNNNYNNDDDKANECTSNYTTNLLVTYVRVFIVYASGSNMFSLVLERYVALEKPLKYLTLMTSRRVIQMVFFP